MATPSEQRESLGEIKEAALRGRNLTRQLLAFSRRQAMMPAAVDLNEIVRNLAKMLLRLIGGDRRLSSRHRGLRGGQVGVRAEIRLQLRNRGPLAAEIRAQLPLRLGDGGVDQEGLHGVAGGGLLRLRV